MDLRPDPAMVKDQALKLAARASERLADARRKQRAVILFAADCGAKPREIAEATGIDRVEVKRILSQRPATPST